MGGRLQVKYASCVGKHFIGAKNIYQGSECFLLGLDHGLGGGLGGGERHVGGRLDDVHLVGGPQCGLGLLLATQLIFHL